MVQRVHVCLTSCTPVLPGPSGHLSSLFSPFLVIGCTLQVGQLVLMLLNYGIRYPLHVLIYHLPSKINQKRIFFICILDNVYLALCCVIYVGVQMFCIALCKVTLSNRKALYKQNYFFIFFEVNLCFYVTYLKKMMTHLKEKKVRGLRYIMQQAIDIIRKKIVAFLNLRFCKTPLC